MRRLDGQGAPAERELDTFRGRIDVLDLRILELLAERARIVVQVGEYKRIRGQPVLDAERERGLLERLAARATGPLPPAAVQRIFGAIVEESRRMQQAHLDSAAPCPAGVDRLAEPAGWSQ